MSIIKKAITFIILTALLTYLFLATAHFQWVTDGGIPIEGARRILAGEVLYRDFFEFWMPGSFYLLAFLTRLFGFSFNLIRVIVFINLSAVCGLTFLIARKLNRSISLGLPAVILFLLPSAVLNYSHNWLGLLFVCLGVWVMLYSPIGNASLRSLQKGGKCKWVLIGLITGLTISFNQWQGTAMFVAASLIILIGAAPITGPPLKLPRPKRRREQVANSYPALNGARVKLPVTGYQLPITQLLTYTLSTSLIPLLWCLFFWQQGALKNFLYAVVIFPLTRYPTGNMEQVPSDLWWITTIFYLIFLFRNKGKLEEIKVITCFGLILHLSAIIAPNTGHTALGFVFTAPLFIYFLKKKLSELKIKSPVESNSLIALLTNRAFITSTAKKIFFFLFACTFLTVSIYNFIGKINFLLFEETKTIQTNYGSIKATPQVKTAVQQINVHLKENTAGEEYVYITPWSPSLYTILNVQNPTRHAHLGFEHYTEEIINEVISDLEKKAVNTIIFLPTLSYAYKKQPDYFSKYLVENFQMVQKLDFNNDIYPPDGIWRRITKCTYCGTKRISR